VWEAEAGAGVVGVVDPVVGGLETGGVPERVTAHVIAATAIRSSEPMRAIHFATLAFPPRSGYERKLATPGVEPAAPPSAGKPPSPHSRSRDVSTV
jgi:hypothetical protein